MDEGAPVMPEEYVRKDVFDAHTQRIEAVVDKKLAEIRGEMSELRGEIAELRGEMAELRGEVHAGLARYEAIAMETRGEVRALAAHIDSLEFWGAIIIGAAAVFFTVAQYFQSKRETIANEVKEQVRELRKTVLELVEAGKIAGKPTAV